MCIQQFDQSYDRWKSQPTGSSETANNNYYLSSNTANQLKPVSSPGLNQANAQQDFKTGTG